LGNNLVRRRDGTIHAEKIPLGVGLSEGSTFLDQVEI
jgi:hypothetical protein